MSLRSWIRRHAGLVALVLSVSVAAIAAGSMHRLRAGAGAGRMLVTEIAKLRLNAEQLNGLEWKAIAEGEISAEIEQGTAEIRRQVHQTFASLRALGLPPEDVLPLEAAFESYSLAVDEELDLIARSELELARELDEANVDPRFAEVSRLAADLSRQLDDDASRRERWSDVGSAVILVCAALVIGLLFILLDEARRASEQLKSEFVSTVSHELRTPLTSLLGGLRLVAGEVTGPQSEDSKRILDLALRNGDRLNHLISDILQIESLERNLLPLNLETLDAADLAREAAEMNRPAIEAAGAKLSPPGEVAPLRIRGDRERLLQVLANLLSNAAKWSPPGGEVRVEVARLGSRVCFRISDQGDGVPKSFEPRLFLRFSQADATNTRRRGGSGLGLSIARQLVEQHDGRMTYEHVVGQGTTFSFSLPLVEPI